MAHQETLLITFTASLSKTTWGIGNTINNCMLVSPSNIIEILSAWCKLELLYVHNYTHTSNFLLIVKRIL